jgi:hypothetical protein
MYNIYIFYRKCYYFSVIKVISPWEKGIRFPRGAIFPREKGTKFPQGEKDYVHMVGEQVSKCLSQNYRR